MNSSERFTKKALDLAKAGFPFYAVESFEEGRVLAHLRGVTKLLTQYDQALADANGEDYPEARRFFTWSPTMGLYEVNGEAKPVKLAAAADPDPVAGLAALGLGGAAKGPQYADTTKWDVLMGWLGELDQGIVAICDANPILENPLAVRMLREAAWSIDGEDIRFNSDTRQVQIVLVGPKAPKAESLAKDMKVIRLGLPEQDELLTWVLQKEAEAKDQGLPATLGQDDKDALATAGLGLTYQEFVNLLATAIIQHGGLVPEIVGTVLDEKADLFRGITGMDYWQPEDANGIGGYGTAVAAIDDGILTSSPLAQRFGLAPHKGILAVGVAGCGKTHSAKVAGGRMRRPVISLNWGAITGAQGGIVGQGEIALDRCLEVCDLIHPILVVDEAEKMWSGLDGGRSDGGQQARLIGKFMSWQASQRGTFVFATCNSIERLDPAQVQVGRWTEVLFYDIPGAGERKAILSIHIAKRNGRDPKRFDLERLVRRLNGYTGREIEQVVERGLLRAFRMRLASGDEARDLTTDDLEAAADEITPSVVTDAALGEQSAIRRLRAWAEMARARRANDPEEEATFAASKTDGAAERKGRKWLV